MTEFVAANTEHAQFTLEEIERLVTYRSAVRAGVFNEGSVAIHLEMVLRAAEAALRAAGR